MVIEMIKVTFFAITNRNRTWSEKFTTLRKLMRQNLKKVKLIRILIKPQPPRFSGWGMTSKHFLPWEVNNSSDRTGLEFAEVDAGLLQDISIGKFQLTQWQKNDEYILNPSDILTTLR